MTITKDITGETATFILDGWLDTQAAPQLQEEVMELPEEVTCLVIDLEKLDYISSSGVRQIVAAHKKMAGNLVLRNVPKGIMSVFEATGIQKKIRIE